MFSFGKRKVTKQGGSYLVSLPMQWIRDFSTEIKEVTVVMDGDKVLRISRVQERG